MDVVIILEEEVPLDGLGQNVGLDPAQPLEPRVAHSNGPHGHGVIEVHVFGSRFLRTGHRHWSNLVVE